jgi:hypothetical protein
LLPGSVGGAADEGVDVPGLAALSDPDALCETGCSELGLVSGRPKVWWVGAPGSNDPSADASVRVDGAAVIADVVTINAANPAKAASQRGQIGGVWGAGRNSTRMPRRSSSRRDRAMRNRCIKEMNASAPK